VLAAVQDLVSPSGALLTGGSHDVHTEEEAARHKLRAGGGGAVPGGVPPGLALGYEALDPFAAAQLAAQLGPGMRLAFTQESILPRPAFALAAGR
jgi:hypothetical protein